MTTVELHAENRLWKGHLPDEQGWSARQAHAERLLPVVSRAVLLAVDVGLVFGAFVFAYWLRFVAPDAAAVALGVEQYVRVAAMMAVAVSVVLMLHGLYDLDGPRGWYASLKGIISSLSTALVLVMTATYFMGDQSFSRLWFATGWLFSIIALLLWRGGAQLLYTAARDALAPANRILIVGANPLGRELADELKGEYQVVGYVDNGTDLESGTELPLLGPIAQLEHVVQTYAVNEVVIALPPNRTEQVSRVIDRGFHRRVKVKFIANMGDLLPRRFDVHEFGGRRYIGFAPAASVSWIKRAMDLVLISLGLVAMSPLLIAVAVAITIDSPGPILYKQRRLGKNGRAFWMYKFRSMVQNADGQLAALQAHNQATGPMFKMREDPRVTRVGRFIRRWSLDELPQLLNVLRGEMSLVGPRPPIPSEVAEYEDWQLGRLRAVPGLTGLWQVSGRSEVPFHDMVRLDLHYVRNWSLALDFEILLRTIPAVLTNRGAY